MILLYSVQHDLEQIADHVIVFKVQHEKTTFDLQSAILVCKATVRLSFKLQHCKLATKGLALLLCYESGTMLSHLLLMATFGRWF